MSGDIIQGEIVRYGGGGGRPSKYSAAIGQEICDEIAKGEPLTRICKRDDMPDLTTVHRWLRREGVDFDQFRQWYIEARDDQADTMFDQITEIADDGTNDWMEQHDKDGNMIGWRVNGEHIARSKLRIEARRWQAARLKPKKYGEATILKHADAEGDRIETQEASIMELARLTVFLLSKAGKIADKSGQSTDGEA